MVGQMKNDKIILTAIIVAFTITTIVLASVTYILVTAILPSNQETEKSGIVLSDNVYIYKNGILVYESHNSMTTNAKPRLNDRVFNSSWTGAVWNYIAIGNGTDDGDNTNNTALIEELDRGVATFWRPASDEWGLNKTFTFAASYMIKEAGVFDAGSNGELLFYVGTLNVAVTSSDTLTVSWTGTTSGTA
jgi:hypothetical protein